MFVRYFVKGFIHFLIILIVMLSLEYFVNKTHAEIKDKKVYLNEQLNQYLQQEPDLHGALAGVSIRSSATGELLYQHNGDLRLRPASNLKLLTAVGALSALGDQYRFTTEIWTDGKVAGSTIKGNLYLKGKGDPTLLKVDFDRMAIEIRDRGIKNIEGTLIGDDTWYDDVRHSMDLPWSDEQTYYGAQISALTASPDKDYDAGTVIIEVTSGKGLGEPAIITVIPNSNYVSVSNHTATVSPDGMKEIKIEREHGTNNIIVKGTIPLNSSKDKTWIAVWEPTFYAIDLFKQSLQELGIKWTGPMRAAQTPENAKILLSHKSMPLSELMIPFMKLSNNGHGETLIKEMGKVLKGDGTWEKGLEVLNSKAEQFGINPNTLVLRDGSGISHVNLVPANEITKLLYSIQTENWFHSFLNSLPVSGDGTKLGGGTLRKRMKSPELKGRVRAKTGTLSTVSSLSGYVETKSGETLIFSIILNNLINEEEGKAIEDKIVAIIAEL